MGRTSVYIVCCRAALVHLLQHCVARRGVVGRIGQQARHLVGVLTQRVEEVVQEALLAFHIPPIDAIARYQLIEHILGKVWPFGPDERKCLGTAYAKLPREAPHAVPLSTQTGSKRRLRVACERMVTGSARLLKPARRFKARNLGRKSLSLAGDSHR